MMTPMTITISTAKPQGTPRRPIRSTKITPRSAMTEPTESSIPPVMMTKASAIENSPKSPIRLPVLERLIGDRKRGLMSATTVPTTRMRMRRPRSFLNMSVHLVPDCKLQYIRLTEILALEKSTDSPLLHDGDPVAHANPLFHVARDHQNTHATIRKL